MKKPIVLPMHIFDVLLAFCAETQPEYQTLKNGFVMRNGEGGEEVHIPYDSGSARELLLFARSAFPKASPYIEAAISGNGKEAALADEVGRSKFFEDPQDGGPETGVCLTAPSKFFGSAT